MKGADFIQKVAVIGSGVMGAQIAAHVANAGYPVYLFDIVPDGAADRNQLANAALERLQKMDPAPLMSKKAARLMMPANLTDDVMKLGECDWIIEAIVENVAIKRDLYKKVDAYRKPGSVVSSNTSTIPLQQLLEGQSERFAADFLITHFFNPPRYLRLLELVVGPRTRKDAAENIAYFCDIKLGKGVVPCHDTPGFIANRIGTYFMQAAINATFEHGLTVEEADAVAGAPMGIPKTGVFGLLDLIGLDLMPLISKSFLATLPADDDYRRIYRQPALFDKMIADGYTGRKGKGGFYKLEKTETGKQKRVLNLITGDYGDESKGKIPTLDNAGKDLKKLCESSDKFGKFATDILAQTLCYTASLVPQIADDIVAIDTAMRLGYNWKFGPFELIDKLGVGWLCDQIKASGRAVPPLLEACQGSFYTINDGQPQYMKTDGRYATVPVPQGVLLLADVKRRQKPMLKNGSAQLWNLGGGVACFEMTTKMNTFDPDVFKLLNETIDKIETEWRDWKGLVIYSDGEHFSAGANLGLAMFAINLAHWPLLENFIAEGQKTFRRLRFAPFPTVAATSGLALGGGCEITLHCSAVQAHAETYMGLVEVGVGIIPGWGGCVQMLRRAVAGKKFGGPIPPIAEAFETISLAKTGKSAFEAREYGYLQNHDAITMNRDRLLFDAKQKVVSLSEGYHPPKEISFRLPGKAGKAALQLALQVFRLQGKASAHDVKIGEALATVMTGDDTTPFVELTEGQLIELERREFMALVKDPLTWDRINHMLNTGKPLRN